MCQYKEPSVLLRKCSISGKVSCKASEMDTRLLFSFGIVVRWLLHHKHHLQSTEVATAFNFSAMFSIVYKRLCS